MRRNMTRRATTRKTTRRATAGTTGKIWTATEISSLRKSYRSTPTRTIARQLRRTMSSVQTKARSLGLKKGNPSTWFASPMKKGGAKKTTAKKTTKKSTARKTTKKSASRGKKK